jgi:EpsI family protein
MMDRRNMILGGACVAAAAAAYELKPHLPLKLLGGQKLAKIVPMSFGDWVAAEAEADGVVRPEVAGTLAARLYSEIIGRRYTHKISGEQVMMLIAYGDTQSDLLQLHRPEICYPAVGFNLVSAATTALQLAPHALLPARKVVARKSDWQENIIYWTRLGEYLPTTSGEQRKARLLTGMKGYIPDGGLFRFSTGGGDPETAFSVLERFLPEMILAIAPARRVGLLGTRLSAQTAGLASA